MVGFINYSILQFLRNCSNCCFNNCWIISLHTCLFWSPFAFLSFLLRKERSEDFTCIFKAYIGFSVWMSELWQEFCYLAVLKQTCLPRSLHLPSCISSYERISLSLLLKEAFLFLSLLFRRERLIPWNLGISIVGIKSVMVRDEEEILSLPGEGGKKITEIKTLNSFGKFSMFTVICSPRTDLSS